jgi:hypothetical protein
VGNQRREAVRQPVDRRTPLRRGALKTDADLLDAYEQRKTFIARGATEQARQTRRLVADYVLRDQGRDRALAEYCREHWVLRQTVIVLIIEFHKVLGWGG